MAMFVFSVLRTKTLVVVHKDFLLNQWKERIEFYLPNAKIGITKQTVFKPDGCDTVLGSLQTICNRDKIRLDNTGVLKNEKRQESEEFETANLYLYLYR